MPETCENQPGLVVNSCITYACQTHEIYQVLPYPVDFKAPREFWNPPSETIPRQDRHWNAERPSATLDP